MPQLTIIIASVYFRGRVRWTEGKEYIIRHLLLLVRVEYNVEYV